ncbi:RNA-binding component of cleavage and polyadenylation factor [Microbotryomycetes sp. JL201]|nr:RNA-binding component of cleavage and polyadenylation factor [Microbotryomycetes sp. JL201]
MATATALRSATSTSAKDRLPVLDALRPDFRHSEFAIESFIKHELNIKLDADETICKQYAETGTCTKAVSCPFRHVTPAPTNFQPPPPVPKEVHARTVCKHWLRGLCKKGKKCDFMHEYNLRKMPECWFFAKYGFCSNGDECMYLHVTDDMRVRECPQYRKGFCRKGPDCPLKHIRQVICTDYVVGFCRRGPECPFGHPKFEPEPEPALSSTRIPDVSGARFLPEATFRLKRKDWLEHAADPMSTVRAPPQFNADRPGFVKRDLSQIDCFKCGQKGHYANHCPNPAVPGDRGGLHRYQQQRYTG